MPSMRPAAIVASGLAMASLASAAKPGCPFTTTPLTWADGRNIEIFGGIESDAACFARCQAFETCNVSIFSVADGSCFLKAATAPGDLLVSLDLATTYCTPAVVPQVCDTTTKKLAWADGANLDSFTGTIDDAACFRKCAANPACNMSIRDPETKNCFLKAAGPADLLTSLTLAATYCTPEVVPQICATTTTKFTWAPGADLNSFASIESDAACFLKCVANPKCNLSIRDPDSGNCFLRAEGPASLRPSGNLSSTYCTPDIEVCPFTTTKFRWVEGADLDSFASIESDAACFLKCVADPKCNLSIRDSDSGNCFLRAEGPADLKVSGNLSSTYCTPAAGPPPPPTPPAGTPVPGPAPTPDPTPPVDGEPLPGTGRYYPNFFVHQPRAFGRSTKGTFVDLGTGYSGISQCQEVCWQRWGEECLYAQWIQGGSCWIGYTCTGNNCDSPVNVNVPGNDSNRIYCKNAQYVSQWNADPQRQGPIPCSSIADSGGVLFTVTDNGVKVR